MEIFDLGFDEENLEHLAAHGLSARRVFQVPQGQEYILMRNKKGGSGQIKMIGPDSGDQLWTVIFQN